MPCIVICNLHFTTNSSMFRTSYLTSVFLVFECIIFGALFSLVLSVDVRAGGSILHCFRV